MKNRLSGFALGVLLTLLVMGLIGTVAATQMSRTAELYYRDIKITLDGTEVQPLDGAGKYVEPFIIDGTTYLPVRAVASALGLEVGWDEATSTVTLLSENYRPQKNGFDGATNQKETLGNYTFSIPSYWGEQSAEEKNKIYYAEADQKVAMLLIANMENDAPISYEDLVAEKDNLAKIIGQSMGKLGGKVTKSETFQGGDGAKGILYHFTIAPDVDGIVLNGEGQAFCFPSDTGSELFLVYMVETDNTDYDYTDDFTKILLTIKKDTGSQGSWIGGGTANPSNEESSRPSTGTSTSGNASGSSSQRDPDDMPDGSKMVYITKTGKRYHYDSTCNGGTYYLTTLEDAQRKGLTPCQKCVLH